MKGLCKGLHQGEEMDSRLRGNDGRLDARPFHRPLDRLRVSGAVGGGIVGATGRSPLRRLCVWVSGGLGCGLPAGLGVVVVVVGEALLLCAVVLHGEDFRVAVQVGDEDYELAVG